MDGNNAFEYLVGAVASNLDYDGYDYRMTCEDGVVKLELDGAVVTIEKKEAY